MNNQILRDPFLENITQEYHIAEIKQSQRYYYKNIMHEISLDNPENFNKWLLHFEPELKKIRKTIKKMVMTDSMNDFNNSEIHTIEFSFYDRKNTFMFLKMITKLGYEFTTKKKPEYVFRGTPAKTAILHTVQIIINYDKI